MKENAHAIYLRLRPEEAVVLHSLATEAGTNVTNYARELIKTGMAWQTGELLLKASSIDDIVREVMDDRLKKLENRLAGLLVKDMTASFESQGVSLNVLKQVLLVRNLSDAEISRIIAIVKDTASVFAKKRISNRPERQATYKGFLMTKKGNLFSIFKEWVAGQVSQPRQVRPKTARITGSGNRNTSQAAIQSSKSIKNSGGGSKTGNSAATGSVQVKKSAGNAKAASGGGGARGSFGYKAGFIGGKSAQAGGGRGFGFAGARVIIKSNYIQGVKRVSAHLKYIEHRQHDERSELFGKNADNLDRYWFTSRIKKYDNVHRIVISPADKDVDLKGLVRETMESFGKQKERSLLWIAAIHKDPKHTSHPHVHLVLSGTDTHGRKFTIKRPDIELMKKEASEYVSREKNLFNAMENFFTGKKKEKEKERDIGL